MRYNEPMNKWALISRSAKRGFTIVELIIVLVVIGILATVVFVGYSGVTTNAAEKAVQSDMKKVDDAFKLYKLDTGTYPDTALKLLSLNLKLSAEVYETEMAANLYICVNTARSEYALVAMARGGKRFVMKSEQGLSEYTGGVVWDEGTANFDPTCASVDATYDSPSDLVGMDHGIWAAWTGIVE